MSWIDRLLQGDGVTRGVALLLLLMSVASWVVILWKAWMLRRATVDVARGVTAVSLPSCSKSLPWSSSASG